MTFRGKSDLDCPFFYSIHVSNRTMNSINNVSFQAKTPFLFLWLMIIALATLGCGQRIKMPETVAVEGKVLLPNGSPLTGGTLVLVPEAGLLGASAQIQPDGRFTLQDSTGQDVAPGKYQVFVRFNDPAHNSLRSSVNERYQQSSEDGESDLIVEIDQATTELTIRLNR